MELCDALIIGGGPAGSSCAKALRQLGLDVVLMDRATFPRDKVCGGWITPAVVEMLALDLDDYARQLTLQPFSAFRIGLMAGGQKQITYPGPVSYGIRRLEFDDYLLRRAGVRLRLGETAKTIVRHGGLWVVNNAVTTALLIGAGGNYCPVARLLGARPARQIAQEQLVLAQQVEFRMSARQIAQCGVRPDTPELYFCDDLKGYGWCLRKGDYLNVGLGREEGQNLAHHVEHFRKFLKHRVTLPFELPHPFNGHAYGLYGHVVRRRVDDGVLLLGDAAALATPRSGEGIVRAIASAQLAAEVIGAAAGNYRLDQLKPYENRLHTRFGPPGSSTQPPWRDVVGQTLGRLLLRSGWFNRHVVLDRWFLHAGA